MTDLRYAIRLLRKSPLFTTTIVLTLVIGVGATTAIFSVVNAILLRPLPFAEPERLMQVAEKNDTLNLPAFGSSALNSRIPSRSERKNLDCEWRSGRIAGEC